MITVNSAQFNFQYEDQIHLPYSISMLASFVRSKEHLKNNFKFEKTFVSRERVEDYIQQCKDSEILLCSCYVWNWEINNHLAKEVKKLNPDCLIIFGGPQVPDDTKGFFEEHPYVDILVHAEGEYILENILNEYLKDKDYSKVKGITTKKFKSIPQERINNLESIPSPYLSNLVWDLVEKIPGVTWICSWETNRGCPYMCTFCDWGSATFTKLRSFSEERLFKEIEWFGKNKIPFIDCCDANFGILQDRDLRIARKMKEMALRKGHLEKIAISWAKNTTEKIIPIAIELRDGGILGAVTLAVQSLDEDVLQIIKRANIKFDEFSDLTASFRDHNIPTYSEIIRGMPGETVESFKKGLEILSSTKIGTVNIYHCMVLPNAPMNVPAYREKFKIKTIRSPVMLQHSSIHKRGIQEYEDIVISTSSFTLDDLKEMYNYSWAFLTLHKFGILEHIFTFDKRTYGLPFMKIYEIFFEYCNSEPESIFSREFQRVRRYRDDGYTGKGWDHYDQKLGEIVWPIVEASWLRLTYHKDRLISDTKKFLSYLDKKMGYNTSTKILNDLLKFQVFMQNTRDDTVEIKSEQFEYDWKNFFSKNEALKECKKNYYYKNPVIENDPIKWSYKVAWYGRRSEKYKCYPEYLKEIQENEINLTNIKIEKEIVAKAG